MAGTLALSGGILPEKLLGPNNGNPKGHFEPVEAMQLNHEFLTRHGSSYYDPSLHLQTGMLIDQEARTEFVEEIIALFASWPDGLLVVKEPRISILLDFWIEAAHRSGRTPKVIIMVRRPDEVAASLAERDDTSPELASVLWLKYNLISERQTRKFPRIIVEYKNLLRDWRAQLMKISRALSLELTVRDEVLVDDFLTTDLHRQRSSGAGAVLDPWTKDAYDALSSAALGKKLGTRKLDKIYLEFSMSEHMFRTALKEFEMRFMPKERSVDRTLDWSNSTWRQHAELPVDFEATVYLDINRDVQAAHVDPYQHYIIFGRKEGRRWKYS